MKNAARKGGGDGMAEPAKRAEPEEIDKGWRAVL